MQSLIPFLKMPNNRMKKCLSTVVEPNMILEASINSPLQRFVRAKKRINQTFEEINNYLKESRLFLLDCDISDDNDQELQKNLSQLDLFTDQVSGIDEVLCRDHMKVAFFGRTSNGKSTVVNAMLSDRILPSGIGHTTNCFVSVVGADSEETHMEITETNEWCNVESLQQLAHALGDRKLDPSSLLKVHWPKSRCPLLRDDVVFVDSPGIDVSPDLDSWIDKHCLDADVFVLVVNSESTLNHTEKCFFHKVNEKLSRPNVFILNNRWDASADDDPEMVELVRQQHLERTTSFLVDELKCVSRKDANDRVFFVSALETLRHRISQKRLQSEGKPMRQESIDEDDPGFRVGKTARRQEFEDFENKFKECISKSAIATKFYAHTSTGIAITESMQKIMEQIHSVAYSQRQWCTAERQDLQDTLDFMTNELEKVTEEIKNRIQTISCEVEQQVTKVMSDEIRRLDYLVGTFDYPFHIHPGFMRTYKNELHSYLEKGLGTNLKAKCSAPLLESIHEYKSAMKDQIFGLIPAAASITTVPQTPRSSFEVSYELDVHHLCADFQEDVTFRFSLGWTSLLNKFIAHRNPRLAMLLGAPVKKSTFFTPPARRRATMFPEDEVDKARGTQISARPEEEMLTSLSRYEEDELTVAVINSLGTLGSTTAMGFVVGAGLVWKALGWKLIGCLFSGYTFIYIYERVMWTNSAKEKCFKKQFAEYASEKLQLVVSFTSKSCSHQVEQELSMTFSQLASQVDSAKEKLKSRIAELNEEIGRLETLEAKAKLHKNKAAWLEGDLKKFVDEFSLNTSKL